MMPGDRLSPEPLKADWLYPPRDHTVPNQDTEMGGIALRDASQGVRVQMWSAYYRDGAVWLSAEGIPESKLFEREGIVEVALAFDLLMNPFVAFRDGGGCAYWFFDSIAGGQVFSDYLPAGTTSPRATLDDGRDLTSNTTDIVLSYLRDRALYKREQRDRYTIETKLADNAGESILNMGMSRGGRLQWRIKE